jgi:hypothetical protein
LCESECDKKYTITADGEMTQFEVIAIHTSLFSEKRAWILPGSFFCCFLFWEIGFSKPPGKTA